MRAWACEALLALARKRLIKSSNEQFLFVGCYRQLDTAHLVQPFAIDIDRSHPDSDAVDDG